MQTVSAPVSAMITAAVDRMEVCRCRIQNANMTIKAVVIRMIGTAMEKYQPLPGCRYAMMPKYMAMLSPSSSKEIYKCTAREKNRGRKNTHRTIQAPIT